MNAPGIRLDKWLWAARCFKTRSISGDACTAGHIKLNGDSSKPAKIVKIGDRIHIRSSDHTRELEIVALSDKRGPATVARELYIDHTPPPPPKESKPVELRDRGTGRPSKRDRRLLQKLRGRG